MRAATRFLAPGHRLLKRNFDDDVVVLVSVVVSSGVDDDNIDKEASCAFNFLFYFSNFLFESCNFSLSDFNFEVYWRRH